MALHQLLNALDKAMHRSQASRDAPRLVADGAPPPQLDLTAPRQIGVGVPARWSTQVVWLPVSCVAYPWRVGSLTGADMVTGVRALVARDRR